MGMQSEKEWTEPSLMVQWLRLHASTAGVTHSIPGWGTKIPYALWNSQKINKNKRVDMLKKKMYILKVRYLTSSSETVITDLTFF